MIYLTYADSPSGVFSSQVNDVVNYLNKNFKANIRLVAFISLRDFRKNKSRIKKEVSKAIVLPMLPKANYWKFSIVLLFLVCLLLREKTIMARGVLACNVALGVRNCGILRKICYDGRGAIAAEWKEYKIAQYSNLISTIGDLEKKSVLKANFRIAISARLVSYWQDTFGYEGTDHVIIPCTLNSEFKPILPSKEEIIGQRNVLGFETNDLILVYSGSTAGWQSFRILNDFLLPFLQKNKHHKILFMSGEDDNVKKMILQFPGQVKCKWVEHINVQKILSACDHGILIREKSITNQVASPTKFAEYLSAGLKVLISEELGDYSGFVIEHNCGQIIKEDSKILVESISREEKQRLVELSNMYFSKSSQDFNYKKLISSLN